MELIGGLVGSEDAEMLEERWSRCTSTVANNGLNPSWAEEEFRSAFYAPELPPPPLPSPSPSSPDKRDPQCQRPLCKARLLLPALLSFLKLSVYPPLTLALTLAQGAPATPPTRPSSSSPSTMPATS